MKGQASRTKSGKGQAGSAAGSANPANITFTAEDLAAYAALVDQLGPVRKAAALGLGALGGLVVAHQLADEDPHLGLQAEILAWASLGSLAHLIQTAEFREELHGLAMRAFLPSQAAPTPAKRSRTKKAG